MVKCELTNEECKRDGCEHWENSDTYEGCKIDKQNVDDEED